MVASSQAPLKPNDGEPALRSAQRPKAAELLHIPIDEIVLGDKLGEGAFGIVMGGVWHGKRVAVKQVKTSVSSTTNVAEFEAEISKMAATAFHENLVQLHGVTTLEGGDMAAVVEFCAQGSLMEALYGDKPRDWALDELFEVAHGAACGVAYLHRLGLVHRDIAARNVLLAGKRDIIAKVADFGMARLVADGVYEQMTAQTIGPLKWMAPEQMEQRMYSRASDVFSFGVLLFEIFKRESPWKGVSNLVTASKVLNGERMDVSSRSIPRAIGKLMVECWTANRSDRPSMAQVQQVVCDCMSPIE
jgi:serine/threonine protein kinase